MNLQVRAKFEFKKMSNFACVMCHQISLQTNKTNVNHPFNVQQKAFKSNQQPPSRDILPASLENESETARQKSSLPQRFSHSDTQ